MQRHKIKKKKGGRPVRSKHQARETIGPPSLISCSISCSIASSRESIGDRDRDRSKGKGIAR